ncbi:response regulator [Chamaesiphon sp.]|uniref:hybrid sensor histidine kinase/response regulator n=1 Tax=Chamaesiphon sp. TaxID=2814140 RepID=UPI003593388D
MEHDRILGYFLEEASEHLHTIEQGLRKLPETVRQPAMIRELFRAAHSIKGSAAMLGLPDVQKIGNQFEANFKLLKEQPQIEVDSHLQSLFLASFSFLQAGIERIRVASDPYHQDPAAADPIGDPVFEQLRAYLQHLVATSNPTLAPVINERVERDPALEQVFGEYVTRKLAEIIDLCPQSDRPEIRTQIQQICQKLGNLGENFEFLEWTNLLTACRLAIANPANALPQLGESIRIAVKQAQVLVLADRHQAIGITPDLEALIDVPHGSVANTRTNHPNDLVTHHPVAQSDPAQVADLLSINLRLEPVNVDLFAIPAAEFDPEAMELNEFMNLLDVPNEGTWMQDENFIVGGSEHEPLEPTLLGDITTDKFYSQLFEPSPLDILSANDLAVAIEQVTTGTDITPAIAEHDEETFYTPDLDGIDDLASNFWSERVAVEPPYLNLDSIDREDYELQPDLSLLDLDVSAPDFGLDRPISTLFPTIAAPENWSELAPPPVENVVAPIASIVDDLQAPALGDLTNFDRPNSDLLQVTNGIASATSDLLYFEELNRRPLSLTIADDLTIPESIDSLHNSVAQFEIDDFDDLQLDILNSNSVGDSIDDFAGLDINPLGYSGTTIDPCVGDEFGLDFSSSGNNDLAIGSAVNSDFADLDFSCFDLPDSDIGSNELNLNPLSINNLEVNSAIDNTFIDLEIEPQSSNNFSDLDLDFFDASGASAKLFNEDDFAGLDLDFIDDSEPLAEISVFSATSPLEERVAAPDINPSDLDLDHLAENSLVDLNIPNINDEIDLNLDIFNIADLGLESSGSDAFGDLDFSILDEGNLEIESFQEQLPVVQSANVDNFADLDFNFEALSAEVTSDELTDLGKMFDEQSPSNLTDTGDLDALLGMALGVGSVVALTGGGSAFNDLDALMANPAFEPAINLDELLGETAPNPTPPLVNSPAPSTEREPTERRSKQSRTFEQTMRVSVRHLNNLNNLVGELVVNRNTLEQDQNRMRQFVEKLLSEVQKLNEVGKRMQDLYERSLMENSLVASRQQYKATIPNPQLNNEDLAIDDTSIEYDPLEMDRFTPIHLLSQKMIELTVRVRESTADIEFVVDGSTEVTRTLRQITGQLQEDLTKSRMVPFAQTADRLQRGVRDNGLRYGKEVELSVEGRDTLIDKVILESLTEPLIHMVNNAIAHGIESAETRLTNHKPNVGKITIRALHQGNQTIISISDDGAGIDTERVKAKAIEKGIITSQQAATISNNEVYELLFLPSFSTKDVADELAGRGVGMDVVRTSITEIRGTIATTSQLGIGTTFTIRLPLALSIAKALIAVNNKSNIAFPMDGIEDTQNVSPEQIQVNSNGEQCIFWRDELMPFKPLSDLLEFNRPLARNNFYTANEDDSDLVSILILRSDGNLIAIQVDKITGDQEIAIKPLQGPASKPLGIAGATVMGDGRIIPIADVMELIALAKGTLSRKVSTEWTSQMTVPAVEVRESMVLIVDDSITVRELLSLTFKRAGYRVEQARDGQEAWDKLRAGLPCDIVFCDIEMPRMDGLEFLSRIQKDPALIKIPIAMLTSRGSDRHRQIASQLGASGYFIKPYLEEALLDAAKRMLKGEVLEIV